VVHYDPPEDHKAYVHRSGRTARAGKNGVVISLVQPEQRKDIRRLQRDIGIDEPVIAPDLDRVRELSPPAVATPAPMAPSSPPRAAPDEERRHDGRGRPGGNRRRNGSAGRGRNNGSSRRGGSGTGAARTGNGQGRPDGPKARTGQGNGQGRPGGPKARNGQGNGQRRPGGNRNRRSNPQGRSTV